MTHRRNIWHRCRAFFHENRPYIKAAGTLDAVYLFSCMGDRLWSFSIGFFIAGVGGLTWVALSQLMDSLTKAICLPLVGQFMDKIGRHRGMQLALFFNNTLISLSALAFYFALSPDWFESDTRIIFLSLAAILNSLSRVASDAQRTAFLKDWIVTIVEDSGVGSLSTHNTITNGIDQSSYFIAPFLTGESIQRLGQPVTCLILLSWNLISWGLEAGIIRYLYVNTPALQSKNAFTDSTTVSRTLKSSSLSVYLRQKCFRPAFAVTLLYCTVLGFDNIAIAYGSEQGMSPSALGRFRSAGALLGFAGVWAYKLFDLCKVNVIAIGAIGLLLQNIFLNLATLSIIIPGNAFDFSGYAANITFEKWYNDAYSAIVHGHLNDGKVTREFGWIWSNTPALVFFFLGITCARFGLWMADPAVQQIMQSTILQSERYRVNLVQCAISEVFSVMKDLLVIAFPLVSTFGALILMSITFVFTGFIVYVSYFITEGFPCRKRRKNTETEMQIRTSAEPEMTSLIRS